MTDPTEPRPAVAGDDTPWSGWIFFNPDTGTELSDSHPVRSGECTDAEQIRYATRRVLRDELVSAWRALAELEAAQVRQAARGEVVTSLQRALETAESAVVTACNMRAAAEARTSRAVERVQAFEEAREEMHRLIGVSLTYNEIAAAAEARVTELEGALAEERQRTHTMAAGRQDWRHAAEVAERKLVDLGDLMDLAMVHASDLKTALAAESARASKAVEVLVAIRDADWVESCLDPQWAARQARAFLTTEAPTTQTGGGYE